MADWKITWGDQSFTGDDLTGADLALAQTFTGDGWGSLDPTRGPVHLGNLIAVVVARRTGRTAVDVLEEIATAPASRLMEALGTSPAEGK